MTMVIPPPEEVRSSSGGRTILSVGRRVGPLLAGIVLVLVVGFILSPYFLTLQNFRNIVITGAVVSVLAVGQFMVIVTAGIDLSVGAVVALSSVVAATLMQHGWSTIAAVLATMAIGTLCGVLSGVLVVYAKITPFIATLGMMGIAQGMAYLVQSGTLIVISQSSFLALFDGSLLGIPKPVVIFVLIMVIFGGVMRWTAFGRQLYAIGGNAEASRLSGLPVKRNMLAAYSLSGLLAGVAGLMLAAQLSEGNSLLGSGLELDAIAAAVVGGASLFGGLGSPVAAVIGGLLIGTISNIMDLLSVQAEPQLIIKGVLILLAVYLTSGAGADLRKNLPALLLRRRGKPETTAVPAATVTQNSTSEGPSRAFAHARDSATREDKAHDHP